MNQKYSSKDGDVTGAGYEFVSNKRQSAGSMEKYIADRHGREKKYLDFVINPDTEAPIRMPSDFTYPTNILSYKQNVQLTIGAAGDFVGYFAPQNPLLAFGVANNTTCSYIFLSRLNTTTVPNYQVLSYAALAGSAPLNFASIIIDPAQAFVYRSNFDSVRVIGACCKIEYIGSLQNTSGMITIAADLVAANSLSVGNQIAPTNTQLYNLLLYKKYMASEQTKSTWFPVDPSVQDFVNVSIANAQPDAAEFSQLIFYFNGYGLPPGAQLDITIETYYEGVPNVASSNLFVASQSISKESKETAWNEILDVGKKNLGQILISGAKTAAEWIGGPIGTMAGKALSWLSS